MSPTPNDVEINASVFDFSNTPIADEYTGCYVKVLDNVFTVEECQNLISLAESDATWEPATIDYGMDAQDKYVDTETRNSERILRFDFEAAEFVYQRLLPCVQELEEIGPGSEWCEIVGSRMNTHGVWKLIGVNERFSFLRYGPGNYFKSHCDMRLDLPDGRRSKVTIQIYLNDDQTLEGGTTRIMSFDESRWVDIEAKLGRVLVFQQKGVWHSGEEVIKGTKYTVRTDFLFVQEPSPTRIPGASK